MEMMQKNKQESCSVSDVVREGRPLQHRLTGKKEASVSYLIHLFLFVHLVFYILIISIILANDSLYVWYLSNLDIMPNTELQLFFGNCTLLPVYKPVKRKHRTQNRADEHRTL